MVINSDNHKQFDYIALVLFLFRTISRLSDTTSWQTSPLKFQNFGSLNFGINDYLKTEIYLPPIFRKRHFHRFRTFSVYIYGEYNKTVEAKVLELQLNCILLNENISKQACILIEIRCERAGSGEDNVPKMVLIS